MPKNTVSRAESKMGACLIASAKLFYEQMKNDLFQQSGEGFCIAVHAYRQDATNGKKKVSAVEIESLYACGITEEDAHFLSYDDFRRKKFISDLLPVGDESGPGCFGLTLRAFSCQGCPTWREIADLAAHGIRILGVLS